MGNTEIEAIEGQIKEAKEFVDFAAAVERLRANKDFQTVVLKGYLEREAVRLVLAKAEPHLQTPESQRSITQQIDAIGAFNGFLSFALRRGEIAAKQVAEGEEVLAEIHAEGDE